MPTDSLQLSLVGASWMTFILFAYVYFLIFTMNMCYLYNNRKEKVEKQSPSLVEWHLGELPNWISPCLTSPL